ncbi:hypothetical protein C8J57DRAFT_1511411 [Mycena rebaudengoi]|nr:hypothetical protein C8J57DRAFT_1511411 [Mycena rebaudengoi]
MAATPPLGAMSAEVSALNDYAAVRYTNIAFLMLMVYDYAITVDTEVTRIWTLQWRLPKVLFFINRYVVPPMLIFDGIVPTLYNLPDSLYDPPSHSPIPALMHPIDSAAAHSLRGGHHATVEIILMLRVFAVDIARRSELSLLAYVPPALNQLDRWVVGEMIAWITVSLLIMRTTIGFPGGSIFPGCLFSSPKYFYAAWIPPVVFESTIILITLYYLSAYQWSKKVNITAGFNDLLPRPILLANLFIARFGRDFLGSLFIAPSSVIACVGAARMMMNIGETSAGEGGPHSTSFEDIEIIEFRHPYSIATQGDDDLLCFGLRVAREAYPATFYDHDGGFDACGSPLQNTDFIVALGPVHWSTVLSCIRPATVQGRTIQVSVQDLCPVCQGTYGIELSDGAMAALDSNYINDGVISVVWSFA